MPILYGDRVSGNCLKVKWVAAHLGIALDWRDVDILAGETRTDAFLAQNPAGKVPALVLDDGRALSESNAIIRFLAHGSELIPADAFEHAKMLQWMFWEQYSHEPYIAVRRFRLRYLDQAEADLDPQLLERGLAALRLMDRHLAGQRFFVGSRATLADVALVAYTRMADQGGFDLLEVPNVSAWIARVETTLGIPETDGRAA